MSSNCGGCRGEGAHRRWCPQVVGFAASLYGSLAEQVESVGDQIGGNDPGLANQAYSLSGQLRRKAEWASVTFQQHSGVRRDGKTEGTE